MIKFSIIIPVYNSEKYLHKTLDSVCMQDYHNFEVICINDGSTDNSLSILKLYQKKYNNLIIHTQKNSGPSCARNMGISLATGEYILFCDSDDWFERTTILSELGNYIESYKPEEIDVVYFPGNTNWGGNKEQSPDFESRRFSCGKDLMNEFCLRGTFLFWGAIYAYTYKVDVIRKYNISFDNDIKYGEDRLWVFDFLDKANISLVYPKSCYFYNVREGSLMTKNENNWKKYNDAIKTAEMLCSRISNYKRYSNIQKHIELFYFSALISAINAGYNIHIKNKRIILHSGTSLKKIFKRIILCFSQSIYKKLFL